MVTEMECSGCGSRMTDADIIAERKKNPLLIACCPERKMVPVHNQPALGHLAYEPADVTLSNAAAVLAQWCPAHADLPRVIAITSEIAAPTVAVPGMIEPHCGEEAGGVQKPLPKTGHFPKTKVIPILGTIS